jgi:chorismate-pyruvate lyase
MELRLLKILGGLLLLKKARWAQLDQSVQRVLQAQQDHRVQMAMLAQTAQLALQALQAQLDRRVLLVHLMN